MPWIAADRQVRLYYEEFGDGPPVLFVHSGAASHAMWEHQVFALLDDHRTVTYDLRGTGRSDVPARDYGLERQAADLVALVDGLGLGLPVLVGHGLGAHIVLRAAAGEPGLAGGLVLVSGAPAFAGGSDGGGFPPALLEDLQRGLGANTAQANADLVSSRSFFLHDPGEATRRWWEGMAAGWPLPVLTLLLRDLVAVDHRPSLAGIGTPALVLHGRHDGKNRFEGAQVLADALPDAHLVVFEHSAHNPQAEELERFNEVLAAFVARHAGRAPAGRG